MYKHLIKAINNQEWEIPRDRSRNMNVPVRIFSSRGLLEQAMKDKSLDQAIDAAGLPGLQKYVCVMPDVHQGYGFPIGGVAASDYETGVISPGAIGYDINCGVRLLSSRIPFELARDSIDDLILLLSSSLPSGIGRGKSINITKKELEKICLRGAGWAVEKGYGTKEDTEHTEDKGQIEGADPGAVSDRAIERGLQQMGSLGSGNHFLEIDIVEQIFDEVAAERMGISKGCLVVQIHCGSRGFGHQVCTDYVREFQSAIHKYNINVPNRELVCAPIQSKEGQRYLAAMRSAANYAFCNRSVLANQVRNVFETIFSKLTMKYHLKLVYDLAHNIGKIETHEINGKFRKVCVHRKGATRAFGPGVRGVPKKYFDIGQPVLIPGSMGTASWVMVGTDAAMKKTFGSCCHGAGRLMSRKLAKKKMRGEDLMRQLERKGIRVIAGSMAGLAEEAPAAYKDVDEVIESIVENDIARRVARLRPIGVIKG
jgi:tRNA-splicing ligase RtcB